MTNIQPIPPAETQLCWAEKEAPAFGREMTISCPNRAETEIGLCPIHYKEIVSAI